MEVILLERIGRLGQMGDTVKVKDGYARNFLLPQGKALRANKANMSRFEQDRTQLEARNLDQKHEAESLAKRIDGNKFIAIRQAGEVVIGIMGQGQGTAQPVGNRRQKTTAVGKGMGIATTVAQRHVPS